MALHAQVIIKYLLLMWACPYCLRLGSGIGVGLRTCNRIQTRRSKNFNLLHNTVVEAPAVALL